MAELWEVSDCAGWGERVLIDERMGFEGIDLCECSRG